MASTESQVRLEIFVENIEAMVCVMEVNLAVYDSDDQDGINIPNYMDSYTLKEIFASYKPFPRYAGTRMVQR